MFFLKIFTFQLRLNYGLLSPYGTLYFFEIFLIFWRQIFSFQLLELTFDVKWKSSKAHHLGPWRGKNRKYFKLLWVNLDSVKPEKWPGEKLKIWFAKNYRLCYAFRKISDNFMVNYFWLRFLRTWSLKKRNKKYFRFLKIASLKSFFLFFSK